LVAGTPVRTAARLVRVNKTSAAYYYHRLRELIYQVVADAAPFAGVLRWMKVILAASAKANAGG